MDNIANEKTNVTRPKDDRLRSLIERVERLEEEKNNLLSALRTGWKGRA